MIINITYIIQHKNNFGNYVDHAEYDIKNGQHIRTSFPTVSEALELLPEIKAVNYYPNWRVVGRMLVEFEVK